MLAALRIVHPTALLGHGGVSMPRLSRPDEKVDKGRGYPSVSVSPLKYRQTVKYFLNLKMKIRDMKRLMLRLLFS